MSNREVTPAKNHITENAPLWTLLFTVLILAQPAQAQDYDLSWYTVDGGGGESTGGDFALRGTAGQADAGALAGGDYGVLGGFWVTTWSQLLTPTPTETLARTVTSTPTNTPLPPTRTFTATHTPLSPTRTATPTSPPVPTTETPTPTYTRTAAPTASETPQVSPTETPGCVANYDLFEDGTVDQKDLLVFIRYLREGNRKADFDCDARVDGLDLMLLSQKWLREP